MAIKTNPMPDELRQLLRYDPETGKLFWKERPHEMFRGGQKMSPQHACKAWNTRYAGTEAFTAIGADGYRRGAIFDKAYLAHRVIWAIIHNEWPEDGVDHVSGDRRDNRPGNLRAATNEVNSRNQKRREDNSSGATGVYRSRSGKKWYAQVKVNYRVVHVGTFDSFDAAVAARKLAEREHGFHANHGCR